MLTKLLQLGVIPNMEFETIPVKTNLVQTLNPFWISGFVTGEGSFTYFIKTRLNSSGKIVKDYSIVFEVSQRTIDIHILNLINVYFNLGKVYTDTKGISRYILRTIDSLINNLIPHFKDYPLIGHKALQYSLWIKIVYILNNEVNTVQRDLKVEKLIK